MNNYNLSSYISDIYSDEASLKSYNSNNNILPSQYIILNKFEFNFDNIYISNLNFYDTNDRSLGISTRNENITKDYKNVLKPISHIENGNNKKQAFNSLENIEENKINNNLKDNNTNNVNNSKIIIEIKKDSKYEDQNENQFLIFNNGNYDTFSSNIIYEALNNRDKKRKEPKKIKKIFKTNSKKQKEKKIKSRK